MSGIVPSYILKLDRAQEHLDVFKSEIQTFVDSHPYTVTKRQEGKKEVWRLHFTSQLPAHISLVGADFVHNVRSALDHLTAALVPASRRDSTYFPILWTGVWDPIIKGEDKQTSDDRAKWNTIVKKMKPEAVEILKSLQPYDGYTPVSEQTHLLDSLNRLWNTDKHSQLPLLVEALSNCAITWTKSDGSVETFDRGRIGLSTGRRSQGGVCRDRSGTREPCGPCGGRRRSAGDRGHRKRDPEVSRSRHACAGAACGGCARGHRAVEHGLRGGDDPRDHPVPKRSSAVGGGVPRPCAACVDVSGSRGTVGVRECPGRRGAGERDSPCVLNDSRDGTGGGGGFHGGRPLRTFSAWTIECSSFGAMRR